MNDEGRGKEGHGPETWCDRLAGEGETEGGGGTNLGGDGLVREREGVGHLESLRAC